MKGFCATLLYSCTLTDFFKCSVRYMFIYYYLKNEGWPFPLKFKFLPKLGGVYHNHYYRKFLVYSTEYCTNIALRLIVDLNLCPAFPQCTAGPGRGRPFDKDILRVHTGISRIYREYFTGFRSFSYFSVVQKEMQTKSAKGTGSSNCYIYKFAAIQHF